MAYKIIGDSCTDLPEELKKDEHFYLVPLTLEIDEYTVIDDETFDQKDFLEKVKNSPNCPKSACPTPEAYMELYGGEEDVYVVTLSSQLSGSYNSAELARTLYLEEHPQKNILVVDSRTASVGQTLIAMKIQELAESGKTFEEVCQLIDIFREEEGTKFVLESLEALRKNGRLSTVKALLCNTLNIKPIMKGLPNGTIDKADQARGMNKALQKMVDTIVEDAVRPEEKIVAIAHCNNYERAVYTRDKILEKIPFKDAIIVDTAGVSSLYASDGGIIVSY